MNEFTQRQIDIAKAFGQLWDEFSSEGDDINEDLCELWEKICNIEGIPHISADEVRNF